MSRRICLSVAVVSLAALFLAACGGATPPTLIAPTAAASPLPPTAAAPTKAPTSEPTATALPPTVELTIEPTTEPTATPTQPAELSGTTIDMDHPIFKAYFAVYNKFPRRTYLEIFNPTVMGIATVLSETEAKDHLRFEIDYGDMTQSLVIITPTIYSLEGGTWRKLSGVSLNLAEDLVNDADSLQYFLNAFNGLASYTIRLLGPEDVNGVPALAYSSEFTLTDGEIAKGKAWIGADGLLLRDYFESSIGDMITTTYEFDPNIKVEAPIP